MTPMVLIGRYTPLLGTNFEVKALPTSLHISIMDGELMNVSVLLPPLVYISVTQDRVRGSMFSDLE